MNVGEKSIDFQIIENAIWSLWRIVLANERMEQEIYWNFIGMYVQHITFVGTSSMSWYFSGGTEL